ncbi:MAG: pyrroline-5-carboxylate reductase [Chloroflexi bacterium]|nr:pyrroline-5-carboxylate reductase [Chloroflexota bacterium]
MDSLRLGFIGGGIMGEAMIKGLLEQRVTTPDRIVVTDISEGRCRHLAHTYGIHTYASNNPAALDGADFVVVAVKPQNLGELYQELRGLFAQEQVLVSIIAGAGISTLAGNLGHPAVVRVMPNTPGQIGQGISVWTATPEVSEPQRKTVRTILGALGEEIFAPSEHYLDMATALSGSGPAYVFLFLEALIDAGVHIGMPRDMATRLTLQTVLGSAQLAITSGRHPAELRNMVTSPGGTTTEGLLRMETAGFRSLITHAVIAAFEKSVALGKPKGTE